LRGGQTTVRILPASPVDSFYLWQSELAYI
jgi:hypothetical protein